MTHYFLEKISLRAGEWKEIWTKGDVIIQIDPAGYSEKAYAGTPWTYHGTELPRRVYAEYIVPFDYRGVYPVYVGSISDKEAINMLFGGGGTRLRIISELEDLDIEILWKIYCDKDMRSQLATMDQDQAFRDAFVADYHAIFLNVIEFETQYYRAEK